VYPVWVTANTGNLPGKVSSTALSFVPSTGTLTTTTFSGALSGTATRATNVVGGNNTTLLGAIPYQSDTNTTTLLSPNTLASKRFLTQTGTGTNGAAPAWNAIVAADVPAALSSTTSVNGTTIPSSSTLVTTTTTVTAAYGGTGGTTGAGWLTVIPTSVSVTAGTGTPSSSVSSTGVITYTSATTLTVNGIFTADYDYYMILFTNSSATIGDFHYFRYTTAGTANQTANYYFNALYAQGASFGIWQRADAATFVRFAYDSNSYPSGNGLRKLEITNPYSNTQRTQCVYTTSYAQASHTLITGAALFDATTRFDGMIFGHETQATGRFTGSMQVLGMKK
jgi:hypothetical protein